MTITREQIELASGAELDAIGTGPCMGSLRIQNWHGQDGSIGLEPDESYRKVLLELFARGLLT